MDGSPQSIIRKSFYSLDNSIGRGPVNGTHSVAFAGSQAPIDLTYLLLLLASQLPRELQQEYREDKFHGGMYLSTGICRLPRNW